MSLPMNQALQLVKLKFLAEQGRKQISPEQREQYEEACQEYPATMQIAHAWWGNEFYDE